MNYIDLSGEDVGDHFATEEEAAVDFAKNYYGKTEYTGLEQGALIYYVTDENGNILYYSYTYTVFGSSRNVNVNQLDKDVYALGGNYHISAAIHTHASSNDFSPLDKTYVMNGGRPLYVVFLNNSNGKVTVRKMRKAGNGTIRTTVANDVSFKKLTKAEKERVKKNIKRLHPKCGDPRCACSMINWMA